MVTWDENLDTIGAGAPIAIQGIGRTATCGRASRHRGIGMPIPQPSVQVVALPTPATGGDRQLQWFPSLPSHTNLPQLLEQEADNRIVDLDSMEERYRTHQGRVDRLEREIARLKKRVDPSPPHTPSNNDPPPNQARGNNSDPAETSRNQGPADKARRRASAQWEHFLKTGSQRP